MSYNLNATNVTLQEARDRAVGEDESFNSQAPQSIKDCFEAMLATYEANGVEKVNINVWGHCPQAREPGTAHIEILPVYD